MSLISFIKEAGEKLFQRAAPAGTAALTPQDVARLNDAAGRALADYIGSQHLRVDNLQVSFDGASGTVAVSGTAADQATKEKIVLCCGNVSGVEKVDDRLGVAKAAEREARYYTVERGDTLSGIAKTQYGDANDSMKVFEANRPMLNHPDRIYPGQVLRIP